MMALLVTDVTLTKEHDQITIGVRFRSRATTTVCVPIPLNAWRKRQTHPHALARAEGKIAISHATPFDLVHVSVLIPQTFDQCVEFATALPRHPEAAQSIVPRAVDARLITGNQPVLPAGWRLVVVNGNMLVWHRPASISAYDRRREMISSAICPLIG
jgi:hypothetical protein